MWDSQVAQAANEAESQGNKKEQAALSGHIYPSSCLVFCPETSVASGCGLLAFVCGCTDD